MPQIKAGTFLSVLAVLGPHVLTEAPWGSGEAGDVSGLVEAGST